jgi:hypothetical protein
MIILTFTKVTTQYMGNGFLKIALKISWIWYWRGKNSNEMTKGSKQCTMSRCYSSLMSMASKFTTKHVNNVENVMS